ncbi:MAG: hypothetical protein MJD61_22355 [Proteobacteria bacterium]|nr:hypothetical protein [Pseudomonadota bacterium]
MGVLIAGACAWGCAAGSGSGPGGQVLPPNVSVGGAPGGGGIAGVGGSGGVAGLPGGAGFGVAGGIGLPPPPVFPLGPIVDPGVPLNAPQVFGQPSSPGGGPCLVAPEVHGPGAMFPTNWLPPRFRFELPGDHDVAELRLRSPTQPNDLVVYTTATQWTMPVDMWSALTAAAAGQPIEVQLRSARVGGAPSPPQLGSTGLIWIAPVPAAGSIIYWDIDDLTNETLLRGFKAGEEAVQTVVGESQVSSSTQCIGCHASTPDGRYLAFSQTATPRIGNPATIVFASAEGQVAAPPFMSPAGEAMLGRQQQHIPAFSRAHWSPGDRIMLSMFKDGGAGLSQIIWTDLEAVSDQQGQGWDVIQRIGDSGEPSGADFSPDGTKIVYASGPADVGIIVKSGGDLYVVPYNQRQGGMALPLAGGSTPEFNEFMPTFSPDSKLVVFARVGNHSHSANNLESEVLVVPANGGIATRLAANDPPQCTGRQSPGTANSWPKWSPEARSVGTRTYYWLLFSSQRIGVIRQLFIAGLVEEAGTLTSYNAVHLWNQPEDRNNLTPTWENVVLAPQ